MDNKVSQAAKDCKETCEQEVTQKRKNALWVDEKVIERNLGNWRQVSPIIQDIVEWCDSRGNAVSPEELEQLTRFSQGLNYVVSEFYKYSRYKRTQLIEQLEKIDLEDEMTDLGWRVLMSVDYENAW
ncbi:MAG: hypothetical protein NWE89_05350 [Candidatus Bathyarchaeota archaeon]|nr:hypothetical protein [Candidatus Bathyarchaeota archaeon]